MARITDEHQVFLDRISKAYEKERLVRETAKKEAERLIAERIEESEELTNEAIAEALAAGVRVTHIHREGLKTKNNKRVYQVRNRMRENPVVEEVPDVGEVKVIEYFWDEPEVAVFSTALGEIRAQVPESKEAPFVPLDGNEDVLEGHREVFIAALKEFYTA